MRRILAIMGAIALLCPLFSVAPVMAASAYANPAFQQLWQQGETVTPNFWGPLTTAHDGQQEPYKEAAGGQRLVQYFDKGRMEATGDGVTSGLLATELVKGQIQKGTTTFQAQAPPAIAIAGDPDNPGPTYAALGSKAKSLFDAAPAQVGNATQAVVSPAGDISVGTTTPTTPTTFALSDDVTKHNVPKAFADYRAKAGLPTIGYALCEPFFTTVKVSGTPRQIMVQVFERRVLTYTATNPAAFQVEMGNVGLHYYQWRYGSSAASPAASPATTPLVTNAAPTGNWAGYVVDTKNVTAVHAAWVIPPVTAPPATAYSSTWVGIGGSNTDDLIQAGTDQNIKNGVADYYAWVEALPDGTLGIPASRLPAHPGDVFSVTITNTSGDDWTVTLENRTTNQHVTLTTTYTSCKCSAEWIEEVQEVNGRDDVATANFGTVTFIEATATVGGVTRNVGDLHAQPLALKQAGHVIAQPQVPGAGGTSFAVAYQR